MKKITQKWYLIIASSSFAIGSLYYVLFREKSAYFIKTPLSKIEVTPALCNFIPDYLWGMSFAASLTLTGFSSMKSCVTVIVFGIVFELCQLLFEIGGAYLADIVAYTTGAVSAHLLARLLLWPTLNAEILENNNSSE